MMSMRPATIFLLMLTLVLLLDASLYMYGRSAREREKAQEDVLVVHVAALGLTDLSVSTEARYTRHPAVSDPVAPFMDHPGALEHFPSGSFWSPPSRGSVGTKL